MQKLIKFLPSRQLAINLFQNLEAHVTSQKFIKELRAEKMVQQYSWACWHWWLVKEKMGGRLGKTGKGGLGFGSNWAHCLEEYTRDHVYQYEEFFSLDVYAELKRRSGTLLWSLDDHFRFNFKKKPLSQIIQQDLATKDDIQNRQKLSAMQSYIENSLNHIKNLSTLDSTTKWPFPSQFKQQTANQTQ